MFLSPSELTLGQAYIYDDFDIEGDIEAAFELAEYLLGQERTLAENLSLSERFHRLPANDRPRTELCTPRLWGALHSTERDRRAIHYHYDLPAEFYALWLDQHMVYSSAYFETPEEDLDSAQVRKLDYICRKLRLRPGDRLLDIGYGWGGLIMYAAAHFGVEAVGITLSVPQAEVARERLREADLNDRCRVEVSDYRDIDHIQQYDKCPLSISINEVIPRRLESNVGQRSVPHFLVRRMPSVEPTERL
jgi:cyclopropane-fatty-acyl-phospholipid synthase